MTRVSTLIGPEYDQPASLPIPIRCRDSKRRLALTALENAESSGDVAGALELWWELGLLDLVRSPEEGVSSYAGCEFPKYAEHFHITEDAPRYARERAAETQDVTLKLQYLTYVLLQMETRGREWIELQRELLECYRRYVDGCRSGALGDRRKDGEFVGVDIERALVAVGRILPRPGVVKREEAAGWADWLVSLAEDSRSFPAGDDDVDQQRHRWIADYLAHLAVIPAAVTDQVCRDRALRLLAEAAQYYQSIPLNDDFERHVAEVEASLRKNWGEEGTHEQLIRRQFDAIVRRAQFHRETGNGLLTAHFYREARRLAEEHRQYFTEMEVAALGRDEQAALNYAIEAGEFVAIRVPIEIPSEMMDFTRDTPDATMQALIEHIVHSVPDRDAIARDVERASTETPLRSLVSRTVVGSGKVVGQSQGEDGNKAFDIEQQATLQARIIGAAVAITVTKAASKIGLTAEHLLVPLAPLALDDGTLELLRRAGERLLQQDFVSAMHILVPQVENVLRQHLRTLGVDTTDYRRDANNGTSRTDDASLGSLMRKSLPDGRTVREYLGGNLWDHLNSVFNSQIGLNLRNELAHGLARLAHCSPENTGLTLSVFYLLADRSRQL
jgi:hypothetical protein